MEFYSGATTYRVAASEGLLLRRSHVEKKNFISHKKNVKYMVFDNNIVMDSLSTHPNTSRFQQLVSDLRIRSSEAASTLISFWFIRLKCVLSLNTY
jgi:hypothetical protein